MKSKPNLLVIFCDQLRRHALGCYGDPNVSTPHIDALARSGTRFARANSTFPICVPFRFSFMTGEYAHSRFVPAIEWRMSPAERTLADELNEQGYETVYCGKWHLYGGHGVLEKHTAKKANKTPVPKQHRGRWQKWLGFDVANDPFDTCYFEDDDPVPRKIEGYQTDGLFDLTMDYLSRRNRDKPFACVLSVEAPHPPLEAPQAYLDKWENRPVTLPPNFLFNDRYPAPTGKHHPGQREEMLRELRIYYAMIENLDDNVGRMMRYLEANSFRDDTIIVFLSDHGQMNGAHSELGTYKGPPFEESCGIPLIVKIPGRVGPQTIDTPTCTEDFYPTLLGLLDIKPKKETPGMDLSPLIRGETAALDREGVLLEFVHDLRAGSSWIGTFWRGFTTGKIKYTVIGDGVEGGKPWQFFDLGLDPWEMNNLIDDPAHADEITRHHRLLKNRMVETGDHFVLAASFGIEGLNTWQ